MDRGRRGLRRRNLQGRSSASGNGAVLAEAFRRELATPAGPEEAIDELIQNPYAIRAMAVRNSARLGKEPIEFRIGVNLETRSR